MDQLSYLFITRILELGAPVLAKSLIGTLNETIHKANLYDEQQKQQTDGEENK